MSTPQLVPEEEGRILPFPEGCVNWEQASDGDRSDPLHDTPPLPYRAALVVLVTASMEVYGVVDGAVRPSRMVGLKASVVWKRAALRWR
jgi:hypothetical protein